MIDLADGLLRYTSMSLALPMGSGERPTYKQRVLIDMSKAQG
jgi:hypothetical protein